MTYDKNYFLNELRNGVSMDAMGQALADAMNEAQEAYAAELAAKEKEVEAAAMAQNKREMALDLIDIIRDYGMMVAPETAEMMDNFGEEDIDMMVNTLDEMFRMMAALAQLKVDLEKGCTQIPACKPVTKRAKSDDEVLANFIASLT